MKADELLRIKAVKYRQKRSLDANSYAWVLMTKIANHPNISSSKEEVYEQMLQRYGPFYEDEDGAHIHITIEKSVDITKVPGHWKYIKDNGKFAAYLMLKGSSEYDTAEMSHFIDRIVEEVKINHDYPVSPSKFNKMDERQGYLLYMDDGSFLINIWNDDGCASFFCSISRNTEHIQNTLDFLFIILWNCCFLERAFFFD